MAPIQVAAVPAVWTARTRPPTTMMPLIALVTLISGVCSAGVTLQMTCQPTKQARTKTVRCWRNSVVVSERPLSPPRRRRPTQSAARTTISPMEKGLKLPEPAGAEWLPCPEEAAGFAAGAAAGAGEGFAGAGLGSGSGGGGQVVSPASVTSAERSTSLSRSTFQPSAPPSSSRRWKRFVPYRSLATLAMRLARSV